MYDSMTRELLLGGSDTGAGCICSIVSIHPACGLVTSVFVWRMYDRLEIAVPAI